MKTKHIGLLSLLALIAPALHAQDNTAAPPPAPYTATQPTQSDYTMIQADLSFPYMFRWKNTGIVGDFGGTYYGNFIGGELSYYDARPNSYSWYNPAGIFGGNVPYRENIWATNVVYRYTFTLPVPGWEGNYSPLQGYVGAGVGVAWVSYSASSANYPGFVGGPGYSDDNKGRFDVDPVAGLIWNFNRNVGLKVGYRLMYIARAHYFYTTAPIDSGALEAGLTFRF